MTRNMELLNQGYYLTPCSDGSAPHILGGKCNLGGAVSPNSGRPLTQMARLDTTAEELRPVKFPTRYLPLLYGWSCAISDGPLCYRVTENNVELVWFTEGPAYDDFPYEEYPDSFREVQVRAVELTSEEQTAINHANCNGIDFATITKELERILRPNHQIGGSPYVGSEIQLQYRSRCCDGNMNFVAAIGNDCVCDQRGFMGNDYAQLLYFVCDGCHLIRADNFCD